MSELLGGGVRNPHCYKWIIYKCGVHADISRDDGVHTSANCGRWEFNSKVMSVVALNNNTRPKHSLKTSYLIKLWVPSKKHTLLYAGTSVHACAVCAPTLGTGAPLFKVSPWALKLWQRTRRGPPPTPPLSLQHPSQPQKILPELPRGEAEGKRDLEERGESTTTTAASKSQQPGEGLWVIFYGRRGTADVHLFISTVSIEVCVHASVCVCDEICHSSLYTNTGPSPRSPVTL